MVDPLLFEARDSRDVEMVRPAHRIHSVLELIGVREMFPAEIIKHHILPCFQTEQWKVGICMYVHVSVAPPLMERSYWSIPYGVLMACRK